MRAQALCADMRLNRALDPATKLAMLNWTDEEGRTALMWAAQKNHLHVAQLVSHTACPSHHSSCLTTSGVDQLPHDPRGPAFLLSSSACHSSSSCCLEPIPTHFTPAL